MSLAYIYGLADPDTGLIRYVGKSRRPKRRFREHLLCKDRGHKTNWIRALRRDGKVPVLEIIDEVANVEALSLEAAYIEYFRRIGNLLVNGTDGGDGVSCYTAEMREKMGHWRGKRFPLEMRRKMSDALRGRPGRPMPPHCKAMLIQRNTGRAPSMETRAKLSAALLGRSKSEQHRQKMSAAKTPELREHIAECMRAVWAERKRIQAHSVLR